MSNTRVSKRSRARGIEKLSSICNALLANMSGNWFTDPGDEAAFNLLVEKAAEIRKEQYQADESDRMEKLVFVYRFNQPAMLSPCMFIDPCESCKPHGLCRSNPAIACKKCRRGIAPSCPKAQAAPPAFTVMRSKALQMVKLGLAHPVNDGRALRLTFSKVATLRGASLNINESLLIAYADGRAWATSIFDSIGSGWTANQSAAPETGAFCNWPRPMQWSNRENAVVPA